MPQSKNRDQLLYRPVCMGFREVRITYSQRSTCTSRKSTKPLVSNSNWRVYQRSEALWQRSLLAKTAWSFPWIWHICGQTLLFDLCGQAMLVRCGSLFANGCYSVDVVKVEFGLEVCGFVVGCLFVIRPIVSSRKALCEYYWTLQARNSYLVPSAPMDESLGFVRCLQWKDSPDNAIEKERLKAWAMLLLV